jgi:hypothetical protein
MKLDQIAYYAHNENQSQDIKKAMGLEHGEWVLDRAAGEVLNPQVSPVWEASVGDLQFNYDLGVEFEILTYLEGPHWHEDKLECLHGEPFLSHLGFHMDAGEAVPAHVLEKGILVQEMNTHSHSNEYVNSRNRTYHYEIYQMPSGPDLKYIWRIEPEGDV